MHSTFQWNIAFLRANFFERFFPFFLSLEYAVQNIDKNSQLHFQRVVCFHNWNAVNVCVGRRLIFCMSASYLIAVKTFAFFRHRHYCCREDLVEFFKWQWICKKNLTKSKAKKNHLYLLCTICGLQNGREWHPIQTHSLSSPVSASIAVCFLNILKASTG